MEKPREQDNTINPFESFQPFLNMSNTESGESTSRMTVPLGKRLEAMETEDVVDVMSEMNTQEKPKELPKTGSLEILLSQYLESEDVFQVDNIVTATSRKIVDQTVKRLNAKYVLPLLDILVMKLEANPRRARPALMWVKAVLHHHSSFLMSVSDLHKRLSLLIRLLSDRSASYKTLLSIQGRLSFVLTYARSLDGDDIDFEKAQIPLVQVKEEALELSEDVSSEEMSDGGDEGDDQNKISKEEAVLTNSDDLTEQDEGLDSSEALEDSSKDSD